jgi:hypothetical protein
MITTLYYNLLKAFSDYKLDKDTFNKLIASAEKSSGYNRDDSTNKGYIAVKNISNELKKGYEILNLDKKRDINYLDPNGSKSILRSIMKYNGSNNGTKDVKDYDGNSYTINLKDNTSDGAVELKNQLQKIKSTGNYNHISNLRSKMAKDLKEAYDYYKKTGKIKEPDASSEGTGYSGNSGSGYNYNGRSGYDYYGDDSTNKAISVALKEFFKMVDIGAFGILGLEAAWCIYQLKKNKSFEAWKKKSPFLSRIIASTLIYAATFNTLLLNKRGGYNKLIDSGMSSMGMPTLRGIDKAGIYTTLSILLGSTVGASKFMKGKPGVMVDMCSIVLYDMINS